MNSNNVPGSQRCTIKCMNAEDCVVIYKLFHHDSSSSNPPCSIQYFDYKSSFVESEPSSKVQTMLMNPSQQESLDKLPIGNNVGYIGWLFNFWKNVVIITI